MQVLLSTLKSYPSDLLTFLDNFISQCPDVKEIYLAGIQVPDNKVGIQILIGLKGENINKSILQLTKCLQKNKQEMDKIVIVDAENSFAKDYFDKIEPYFRRKC